MGKVRACDYRANVRYTIGITSDWKMPMSDIWQFVIWRVVHNGDADYKVLKVLYRPRAVTSYLKRMFDDDKAIAFDAGTIMLEETWGLVRLEVQARIVESMEDDELGLIHFDMSAYAWLCLKMDKQFERMRKHERYKKRKDKLNGNVKTSALLDEEE